MPAILERAGAEGINRELLGVFGKSKEYFRFD